MYVRSYRNVSTRSDRSSFRNTYGLNENMNPFIVIQSMKCSHLQLLRTFLWCSLFFDNKKHTCDKILSNLHCSFFLCRKQVVLELFGKSRISSTSLTAAVSFFFHFWLFFQNIYNSASKEVRPMIACSNFI